MQMIHDCISHSNPQGVATEFQSISHRPKKLKADKINYWALTHFQLNKVQSVKIFSFLSLFCNYLQSSYRPTTYSAASITKYFSQIAAHLMNTVLRVYRAFYNTNIECNLINYIAGIGLSFWLRNRTMHSSMYVHFKWIVINQNRMLGDSTESYQWNQKAKFCLRPHMGFESPLDKGLESCHPLRAVFKFVVIESLQRNFLS